MFVQNLEAVEWQFGNPSSFIFIQLLLLIVSYELFHRSLAYAKWNFTVSVLFQIRYILLRQCARNYSCGLAFPTTNSPQNQHQHLKVEGKVAPGASSQPGVVQSGSLMC